MLKFVHYFTKLTQFKNKCDEVQQRQVFNASYFKYFGIMLVTVIESYVCYPEVLEVAGICS